MFSNEARPLNLHSLSSQPNTSPFSALQNNAPLQRGDSKVTYSGAGVRSLIALPTRLACSSEPGAGWYRMRIRSSPLRWRRFEPHSHQPHLARQTMSKSFAEASCTFCQLHYSPGIGCHFSQKCRGCLNFLEERSVSNIQMKVTIRNQCCQPSAYVVLEKVFCIRIASYPDKNF